MNQFDGIDFNTTEGARIGRMLSARADELRSKLEDSTLDATGTALVRGALQEVKRLLAKPAQFSTNVPYAFPGGKSA
jgi:hypothetical protein